MAFLLSFPFPMSGFTLRELRQAPLIMSPMYLNILQRANPADSMAFLLSFLTCAFVTTRSLESSGALGTGGDIFRRLFGSVGAANSKSVPPAGSVRARSGWDRRARLTRT